MILVTLLGAATPGSGLSAEPSVRGAGKDQFGGAFTFRAAGSPTTATGTISWQTISFGLMTGPVDCVIVVGRRAALSGMVDVPVSGWTHYLIIAEDRGTKRRPKDEGVIWLSNRPFDCVAEVDGNLADAMKRITKGAIVI